MTTILRADLEPVGEAVPRQISKAESGADRLFVHAMRMTGATMLVIVGGIGIFLAVQGIPTFRHYGLHFFTETQWEPETDKVGVAAVLVGTLSIASVALLIAFPLSVLLALYISEYSPLRFRGILISGVDLMAAVPSIIYGLWGALFIQPKALYVSHWLNEHLGFIPFFRVDTDARAAAWQQTSYTKSAFVAGIAVAMMVIPMATSVMREVFSQAPAGEREAAYALGATRWGMIRSVVLPFGRGGIIGGTMLGLGRALGETIAVVLIISPAFIIKARVLELGTNSVSALIALRFGEATGVQLQALLAAGFILFVITLMINTAAAIVVSRSRSGAGTDL